MKKLFFFITLPRATLFRIPGRIHSLRRDVQVPGDIVYHVAKHRIKERTGNSGRAASDEFSCRLSIR